MRTADKTKRNAESAEDAEGSFFSAICAISAFRNDNNLSGCSRYFFFEEADILEGEAAALRGVSPVLPFGSLGASFAPALGASLAAGLGGGAASASAPSSARFST